MSATYFQQIFELSIFGIQKYSDYLRKQRCNRKVRLKKKKSMNLYLSLFNHINLAP